MADSCAAARAYGWSRVRQTRRRDAEGGEPREGRAARDSTAARAASRRRCRHHLGVGVQRSCCKNYYCNDCYFKGKSARAALHVRAPRRGGRPGHAPGRKISARHSVRVFLVLSFLSTFGVWFLNEFLRPHTINARCGMFPSCGQPTDRGAAGGPGRGHPERHGAGRKQCDLHEVQAARARLRRGRGALQPLQPPAGLRLLRRGLRTEGADLRGHIQRALRVGGVPRSTTDSTRRTAAP